MIVVRRPRSRKQGDQLAHPYGEPGFQPGFVREALARSRYDAPLPVPDFSGRPV
jgi:hypothetical protein